jgi:aspartyl-tRNA(Asn)/glutamyl-tRNA(Gln) amidotransferase subunit C
VDRALLDHLTALARIELSASERPLVQEQLARILSHFRTLSELPGPDDLTEAGTTPVADLRPDTPRPSWPPETMLGQAPDRDGEFYRVPRIVEG